MTVCNPDSFATSSQINVTFRWRSFGLRWSEPARTAAIKSSIAASLISLGSILLALA